MTAKETGAASAQTAKPPYAPELNPVEHLWDDLREKSFHNRVFDSLDALENHLEVVLLETELDQRWSRLFGQNFHIDKWRPAV